MAQLQTTIQNLTQQAQQLQQQMQQQAQQSTGSPQARANPNRQTMSLSQMPSMDLNSKQNNKTKLESVDSIKETLFAALNKKMGN
jgi:hypothetical protein